MKNIIIKNSKKFTIIATCLAIAIILLICFIFYRISQNQKSKQYDKEREILITEQQEQLSDITEYLNEIEEVISTNQEQLGEISLSNMATEKELNNLYEKLMFLNDSISKTNTILSKYIETYKEDKAYITEINDSLSLHQEEISTQIANSHITITEILNEMKSTEKVHFTELTENMMLLFSYFEEIRFEMETYHEELITLIELFQEDANEKHEELLTILQEAQENMASILLECTENIQLQLNKDFLSLMEKMDSLRQQVTEAKENVSSILFLMEENAENRQDEIRTAFAYTNSILELIKSNFYESQEEIKALIIKLQESEAERHAETIEKLLTLFSSFGEMRTELELYYNDVTTMIAYFETETKANHEELLAILYEAEENLKILLSECTDNIQLQMDADMIILMERFEDLGKQIEKSEKSVSAILSFMEENAELRQKEILNTFQSMEMLLQSMHISFQESQDEIKALIVTLQEFELENHTEVLSVLEVMEYNMSESSIKNLNQITSSLQSMQELFDATIINIQNDISDNFASLYTEISSIGSSIFEHFEQLDNNVSNQYNNLTNIVNNDNEEIKGYLTEAFRNLNGSIDNKFDAVFQRVSSGKKLLASALLTKGIYCPEDATFQRIYQSILDIPQELLIGVEQIPGDITYEYHYHKDGKGNTPHTEQVSIGQIGGCYSNPVYHVHTGDSRNGGGCFTKPINHTHAASCKRTTRNVRKVTGFNFTGQGTGHACCSSSHGQNWAVFYYIDEVYIDGVLISSSNGQRDLGYSCGVCVNGKAYGNAYDTTKTEIICGYTEGINGYDLGCGKTTSTAEKYTPTCGCTDGQIIGAIIVYKKNALTQPLSIIYPEDTIIEENGEDILPVEEVPPSVSSNIPYTNE